MPQETESILPVPTNVRNMTFNPENVNKQRSEVMEDSPSLPEDTVEEIEFINIKEEFHDFVNSNDKGLLNELLLANDDSKTNIPKIYHSYESSKNTEYKSDTTILTSNKGTREENDNATGNKKHENLENNDTSSYLNKHLKSHIRINCIICGKTFTDKQVLESHLKSHLNIGGYKCTICEKAFIDKCTLTKHLKTHVTRDNPVSDIICSLIETPFSRRSESERKEIISSGRPLPNVDICRTEKKDGGCFVRTFRTSWYESKKWLCGSIYKKALFCWPCLLLSKDRNNVWVSQGFTYLKNLSARCKLHEQSKVHMLSYVSLKKLEKNALPITDLMKDHTQLSTYNEEVRKNRRLLEYFIDVTVLLAKQELGFREYGETSDSVNRGNFREIFDLLIKRDSEMKEHIKKIENVFTDLSKTIQNDLVSCISDLIQQHINSEIASTSFFSILADDTTDILEKSQCALSIRFVDKLGIIRERFLGFYDVSEDRSASALYNIVTIVMKPYNYKEKLIAQCYNGASVMAESVNGLQMRIKQDVPNATFTHCSAHRLNLVLQNGTKCIEKCRIFFSSLTSIPTYFNNSAKRIFIFDDIVGKRIPRSCETMWSSRFKTVHIVESEWFNLKKAFSNIIDDPTLGDESVNGATGYLNLFNNFEFAFLTLIFNEIYNITDPLFKILQLKSLDFTYCQSQIKLVENRIQMLRTDSNFDTYYKNAIDRLNRENEEPVSKRLKMDITTYQDLYFEIIDSIVNQMDARFRDMSELSYLTLADSSKFIDFRKSFPDHLINHLNNQFKNVFEKQKLINELTIIYQDTLFKNINIDEMLRLFNENDYYMEIFPETYKLFILIATVPLTSVSVGHNFSCLKRIENYLRNSVSLERLSAVSLLSIEKELLSEMSKKDNFTELVINLFSNLKDRPINLIYK